MNHRTGNKNSKLSSEARWQSWAEAEGFRTKREMLEVLYREWSIDAIADLLGVCYSAVRHHLKIEGIKTRGRGNKKGVARNVLGEAKIAEIRRCYRLNDGRITYAELARRFRVDWDTAKKYAGQLHR